jgi:hypothetical protein
MLKIIGIKKTIKKIGLSKLKKIESGSERVS